MELGIYTFFRKTEVKIIRRKNALRGRAFRVIVLSERLHVLPDAVLCGCEDRVADFRGLEGVVEGRVAWDTFVEALQEVGHLMDEGVFVADAKTGHPPFVHVGHVTVSDVHTTPAASGRVITVIEVLEAVQIVQIPADGGVGAVDLQRVQGLVAARVPGGLKQAERSIVEVTMEDTGVVDGDFLFFAGGGVDTLFNERLGHGGYIIDAAVEPDSCVDTVGQQIASHAAAGCGGVEPPEAFAALREIGTDGPVLQEVGSVMEDLAEFAALDDLLGEGDSGHAAVVVPHGIGDAGFLHGLDHRHTFLGSAGQWFFTQHHLAGFGGGDSYLGVLIVRRADIDGVDVVALDQFAPIGFVALVAPLFSEGLGLVFGAAAYSLEHGAMAEIVKEVADALVTVGVGTAHEAVAHQSDIEGFLFAHLLNCDFSFGRGRRGRRSWP